MKIAKIKIENFRSIKSTEFDCSSFNIFVGQNNCGKTNFFEAIEFFFNGVKKGVSVDDLKFKRNASNEILISIDFTDALAGAASMQNDSNRTKITNALGGSDVVSFVRTSENPSKRTMIIAGQEVRPGTGFDAALNDFLPKFEYISTKQYYDSVAKYGKTTPIGIMLSGVLSTILQTNPQYLAFQEKFRQLFEEDDSEVKAQFDAMGTCVKLHLEKQFPDTTKVAFEVTAPVFDDLLKNFDTSIDDGVETSAEEKGDGMQRALMLAIIQAYADYRKRNDDLGKSFIFFIDEAELHLHPMAQRKLKNVLHILSQDTDQVFINTHSSVFVADDYDDQTIFRVEKSSGQTSMAVCPASEKPYVVYELLGGSPGDLLLPQNFLIIEGQSEFEFLTRVIQRFYPDRKPVQLLKANGDTDQAERTINAIEKIYTPLGTSIYKDKVVILIDRPSPERTAGVNEFRNRYRSLVDNQQLYELTARDLEQCYPDQPCPTYTNWRKTQGELDAVNGRDEKIFTGHKKKQLAKHVGAHITQQQFETDMPECFRALSRCWELSF